MLFILILLGITMVVFLGMLCTLEIGRRLGRWRKKRDPDAREGTGIIEGAIFGLLGLMLAFTFNGAAGRFDARRQLIVREVNAAGTAWMRLDFLPADSQPVLRARFKEYLDARIKLHQNLVSEEGAYRHHERTAQLQKEIWKLIHDAVEKDGRTQVASLMIPALNEWFDTATARVIALHYHVPIAVLVLLYLLALLASLLAGYAMAFAKYHNWLHVLVFAAIMSITVMVTIDLEYPRVGFIRVDDADQSLIDLLESWK